jgi:hypothetical protein
VPATVEGEALAEVLPPKNRKPPGLVDMKKQTDLVLVPKTRVAAVAATVEGEALAEVLPLKNRKPAGLVDMKKQTDLVLVPKTLVAAVAVGREALGTQVMVPTELLAYVPVALGVDWKVQDHRPHRKALGHRHQLNVVGTTVALLIGVSEAVAATTHPVDATGCLAGP